MPVKDSLLENIAKEAEQARLDQEEWHQKQRSHPGPRRYIWVMNCKRSKVKGFQRAYTKRYKRVVVFKVVDESFDVFGKPLDKSYVSLWLSQR